ncbi:GHMP kinase [Algibacter amylolyticus]|uniref:GHMP kinase n=1 Tax=Algibacter amylolyticus TaxID=1608400 RepID=A0A5M7ASN4_9FLAO|nr:GYDIA family GHMP kinase [Algibacter amylolyticus]KAA5820596.1 GHMP kinase [Algibacter amylolyticus]MBB5269941.1 mevalonate kinase [Algibacter amylolyticus]TSJ71269.1 GHMP kinase [Algibacter amylolyticus]
MKNNTFYSHGKLLLSAEYVVLDGALALAIPTKYGQSLIVEPIDKPVLHWKSFDETKNIWFDTTFDLKGNTIECHDLNNAISNRLIEILQASKALNPEFLNSDQGYKIETHLEFPKNWGLGTSSTLITNIAKWANIDPFQLLEKTFGGSGYDIACAQHNQAITYKIAEHKKVVEHSNFNPIFKEQLYFVHLNKKQNSRDGIKHYHENKKNAASAINAINKLTLEMINCQTLDHFQDLMVSHENLIAKLTKQTPVKDIYFKDFDGAIKSLGAWGGDFVLVASKQNPTTYFNSKGFNTVIPYGKMAL